MSQDQTQSSHIRTRLRIVDLARSLVGTRFKHQGRTKEGLDCVGVVIKVGSELGLLDYDVSDYQKRTSGHSFLHYMREAKLVSKNWKKRAVGDILLMHDQHFPCHLALLSCDLPQTIIHAHSSRRCVLEELYEPWKNRFVGLYEFPGLS